MICIQSVWEQYRTGNIVTEDNFDSEFQNLVNDDQEMDEDLRFCCHLMLKQLFKILDDHSKDNRRFLSDMVFTLTMVFKSKGLNVVTKQYGANRRNMADQADDRE